MSSAAAVQSLLGGPKVLGTRIRSASEWADAIRAGFPAKAAFLLQQRMELSDAELAELIGVSARTLSRIRTGRQRMDPVVSDRLYRLARIVALASDVIEDENDALTWLKSPQYGLGERVPLSMLTTEAGTRLVE